MSDESLDERLGLAAANAKHNMHLENLDSPVLNSSSSGSPKSPASAAMADELNIVGISLTESKEPETLASRDRPQASSRPKVSKRSVQTRPNPVIMDRKLRQNKPRLLLMGQRRSGKSSITSVVFHKMSPGETLFLESTTRIQKDSMHSFMDFQVWDFPGQLDYFDPTFDSTDIFAEIGALVWVIDAQDDYSDSLARLTATVLNLQTTFPHINVEVFVHKTDSLNDEYKSDIFQDITQRVGDELSDAGYVNANINYYLTSIYNYSIFEAFSKVIQRLIPQLATLENLLDILLNGCGMAKAYLFDVTSKIYVASDTRPSDMEVYEMCSDYVDMIVDISGLYNYPRSKPKVLGEQMDEAESSMTLEDGTMIYLKEMNSYLCLVAVIKHPEAKDKKGLIDYNCHVFQEALNGVFARGWEQPQDAGQEDGQKTPTSTAQASLEAQL